MRDVTHRMLLVERVHYLRARAQRSRWSEELRLVQYEMEWTTRYFLYQSEIWQNWSTSQALVGLAPGPVAYGQRQRAMWYRMAIDAEARFKIANPSYNGICRVTTQH